MSDYGTAHLYGQGSWHDPVYLLADRKGLTQLRDAIDAALASGQAMTELFVNDGEGYDVFVIRGEDDGPHGEWWADVANPYVVEYAAETDEQTRGPWDMLDLETMVAVGPEGTQDTLERLRDYERARRVEEE